MVVNPAFDRAPAVHAIPFSAFWILLATIVAAAYIAVLGPGIQFAP